MRYLKAPLGMLFAATLATLTLVPTPLFATSIVTVPTGLTPGSQYRLAFVTSGTTTATSTNISDYNTFVTNQVALVPTLANLGATWTAIASTGWTSALTNTLTSPQAAIQYPIFNLYGQLVASNYSQLYTISPHSLNNPIDVTPGGNLSYAYVWTGTLYGGDSAGAEALGYSMPIRGFAPGTNLTWYVGGNDTYTTAASFYAISTPLSVPRAVPEPPTLGLLAFGLLGLIVVGLRRRTA